MKSLFTTLAMTSALTASSYATAQSDYPKELTPGSWQRPTAPHIEEVYVRAGAPAPGSRMAQAANIDLLQ